MCMASRAESESIYSGGGEGIDEVSPILTKSIQIKTNLHFVCCQQFRFRCVVFILIETLSPLNHFPNSMQRSCCAIWTRLPPRRVSWLFCRRCCQRWPKPLPRCSSAAIRWRKPLADSATYISTHLSIRWMFTMLWLHWKPRCELTIGRVSKPQTFITYQLLA